MKPSFSLLFCLVIFCNHVSSQQTNLATVIKLDQPPYTGDQKFPFSKFEIVDIRQDTSKVGYFAHNHGYAHKLVAKAGFENEINNFLSKYYEPAFTKCDYSVLVVVKKLWVSQYDSTKLFGDGEAYSGKIAIQKLKVEFYLKQQNNFYTIFRVDTSIFINQRHKVTSYSNEIGDGITIACDKLFDIKISEILKKRTLSYTDIEKFNNKLFDKPILQASTYNKGVYMTFSEFLNNQPSVSYNDVDKKHFGDVLYLRDGSGNEYPSNNFWGYSDGKDIYITSGKNFYKLYRVQNTFEFFGVKYLRERFTSRSNVTSFGQQPSIMAKRKPEMDEFLYQVDMETGETY